MRSPEEGFHAPTAIGCLGANPVSFTPGFSQVNHAKPKPGNRLNGFPIISMLRITRLKLGVNENFALNPFPKNQPNQTADY